MLLLGLANLPALPLPIVLQALATYQEQLQGNLRMMVERWHAAPVPRHVAAMFELSQALMMAEIDWLTQFIKELEK